MLLNMGFTKIMDFWHDQRIFIDRQAANKAPDAGDSGAIPSILLRLSIFQSDGVPPPAPARVNTNHWAVQSSIGILSALLGLVGVALLAFLLRQVWNQMN